MTPEQYQNIFYILSGTIFFLGITTFFLGVFVLVYRSFGKDMRILTTKTVQLAQKGLHGELPGLVGNASALMNALQQMVKTAAGIGALLVILGISLMGSGIFLLKFTFEMVIA